MELNGKAVNEKWVSLSGLQMDLGFDNLSLVGLFLLLLLLFHGRQRKQLFTWISSVIVPHFLGLNSLNKRYKKL